MSELALYLLFYSTVVFELAFNVGFLYTGKPVSNGRSTTFIICIVDEENDWVTYPLKKLKNSIGALMI